MSPYEKRQRAASGWKPTDSPSTRAEEATLISERPQIRENPEGRAQRRAHICPALIYETHPDPEVRKLARAQGHAIHDLNEVIYGKPDMTPGQRRWARRCRKAELGPWQLAPSDRAPQDPDRFWKSRPRIKA